MTTLGEFAGGLFTGTYMVAEGHRMTYNELKEEYDLHAHMECAMRSFEDYIAWRATNKVEPLVVIPPQPSLWRRLFH